MSLSKSRAKKREQALESVATAPSADLDTQSESAAKNKTSSDIATLDAEPEQESVSVASIGGQTTGPVEVDSGGSGYSEDVGGDLGEGGFFGWLGGLFGWGSSSTSVSSSSLPRTAASSSGLTIDKEDEAQNEAAFEEEEWKRAEETQYLDYDKKQRTKYTGDDGTTRTYTTQQTESSDFGRHSSVSSDLGPFADKEKTTKWGGTNKVGAEMRVDDSRTVGDTTYGDYYKFGGEGSFTKDGDNYTTGAKLSGGHGDKITQVNADGSKTTHTSDHSYSVSGDSIRGKKDDQKTQDYGAGIEYGYTTGTIEERVTEDGSKVSELQQEGIKGGLGYRTDKGTSGSLTFTDTTQTRSVAADGTPITTGKHEVATTVGADKQSVGVNRKVTDTHSERVDKLGKHTRLTTTVGKTEAEAGAKAGKDDDGN